MTVRLAHLVKGSRHSEEAKLGLYPAGEHRAGINHAFSEYFKILGAYLNSGLLALFRFDFILQPLIELLHFIVLLAIAWHEEVKAITAFIMNPQ